MAVSFPVNPADAFRQLTPEQQRTLEAVQKFLRDKEEAWAKLSQAEREAEEAAWERFKDGVNADRAGYRKVFVD